jgi:hypothetical protein
MSVTLRTVRSIISGRYCDPESGDAFSPDTLTASLSDDLLDQPVELVRVERGIYLVVSHDERVYLLELSSRRRQRRE